MLAPKCRLTFHTLRCVFGRAYSPRASARPSYHCNATQESKAKHMRRIRLTTITLSISCTSTEFIFIHNMQPRSNSHDRVVTAAHTNFTISKTHN
jgi:hypothetical protein